MKLNAPKTLPPPEEEVYNARNELVFKKPLWLSVMGKQRDWLSLQEIL